MNPSLLRACKFNRLLPNARMRLKSGEKSQPAA
jgi:hypothetical protein